MPAVKAQTPFSRGLDRKFVPKTQQNSTLLKSSREINYRTFKT